MNSEVPSAPAIDDSSILANATMILSHPGRRNQKNVPRRIHKAKREKMKREQLNELFLSLANVLDLTHQNSGKASTLGEATRIVKDTIDQIEGLKRENTALLNESQYVIIENNELKDETVALEIQIRKLRSELNERLAQSKLDLNAAAAPECQQSSSSSVASQVWEDSIRPLPVEATAAPRLSIMNPPFYAIPFHSDFQVHPWPVVDASAAEKLGAKPVATAHVRKPLARYPNPTTRSWSSSLLLERRPTQ